MKQLVGSFVLLLILISFSILLVSCSSENGITSPPESKTTPLAKEVVLPMSSINHVTDTLITLPKSKKTLLLSKSYTTNQISQIDNFLTSHTIKTISSGIKPNTQSCSDRVFYNWEIENNYQTASGKYLGIWCDYLTSAQLDTLGFNQLFISGNNASINSAISDAVSHGFNARNLMVSIGSNTAIASSIITGTNDVGYYFVDEPFETQAFNDSAYTVLPYLAGLIHSKNSADKLFTSSYDDPYSSNCSGSVYVYYENLFIGWPWIDVMCDEYYTNCCRATTGYWDAFKSAYGSNNIANWMHVVINNGNNYGYPPCSGPLYPYSSDWSSLFGDANNHGITNLWLYAYGTGDLNAVLNFAYHAWATGWMVRLERQVCTEWKCVENNCTTCNYPTSGTWYLANMYYTGVTQYVSY